MTFDAVVWSLHGCIINDIYIYIILFHNINIYIYRQACTKSSHGHSAISLATVHLETHDESTANKAFIFQCGETLTPPLPWSRHAKAGSLYQGTVQPPFLFALEDSGPLYKCIYVYIYAIYIYKGKCLDHMFFVTHVLYYTFNFVCNTYKIRV